MKKFSILTLGCRVNHYESQVLSEELTRLGYENAPFTDKCDVYIVNSCAVTEESVRKSKQMIRRAIKKNPNAFIAICGCASQLHSEFFAALEGISFVCGTRNKEEIIAAIAGKSNIKTSVKTPTGALSPTHITKFDRTRAYVKIQDGCEGKCAYCIIPKVRGSIVVRDEEEIVDEVRALADGGCHEIVLTGIETSAYGKGLSRLIKRISQINGIERIRMGSLDPSFLKPEFIDEIYNIPQVCPHFHISLQNGSDRILNSMRRKYNTEMIEKSVSYIRSKMPNVNFSADVIVGFPGESDEDFDMTCQLVQRIGFLHLHIFTYSKRPDTEAATMKGQIAESVKTDRLHRLSEIADGCKNAILDDLISSGENVYVLVETANKGYLTGHTDNFIECRIPIKEGIEPSLLKGTLISVRPKEISDGYLICSI